MDTGLTLNFHSLAPMKYKRSVVIGFVHRIFRSCSSWKNIHLGLEEAKKILTNNQYPLPFIEENRKKEEQEKQDDIIHGIRIYDRPLTEEYNRKPKCYGGVQIDEN